MIFYSDTEKSTFDPRFAVPFHKQNANRNYLRHYDNYLFLDFMMKKGNMAERHQAAKELTICERKLAHWERHPNFNKEEALREVAAKKKQWNTDK